MITPEIVHTEWPRDGEGVPQIPSEFCKTPSSDYLNDRNQHLLIRMKPNSVINDLVAKIISYCRFKAKEVCLFRAKLMRNQWRFIPVDDSGNTSIDIFGPPFKGCTQVEIFYVQIRKPSADEPSILAEPDPANPIFVKMTEQDIEIRNQKFNARQQLIEEHDLDEKIAAVNTEK